jgi:hypothetical protein
MIIIDSNLQLYDLNGVSSCYIRPRAWVERDSSQIPLGARNTGDYLGAIQLEHIVVGWNGPPPA